MIGGNLVASRLFLPAWDWRLCGAAVPKRA